MKKVRWIFILAMIAVFIVLIFLPEGVRYYTSAVNGVIDFSEGNFVKTGESRIGGQWELYYGKFLSPEEVKNTKPDGYYNVPGKLENQVNGKNNGFMTIHFKVKTPTEGMYGLCIDSMFTSSEIFVNGIRLDEHGIIGKSKDEEKATYRPMFVYFPSRNKEADVVIHTSVYQVLNPSISTAVFGTGLNINKMQYREIFIDSFLIGIFAVIGLINLVCYFKKPRRNRNLYFAIICFLLVLRSSILNTRILCQLNLYVPYEFISKVAAITFYLLVTFYILFIDDVFKKDMKIKVPAVIYGVVFTAIALLTRTIFFDRLQYIAQAILFLFVVYVIVFVAKRKLAGDKSTNTIIIPLIILFIAVLNDVMVNNKLINTNYASVFGSLFFVVSQSGYIIKDYIKSYEKLQKLNRDSLTSLYNNHHIKKLIDEQLEKYKLRRDNFSLIMVDIDNFKSVNDSFGHMFGDMVIKDVADLLSETADEDSYVGRFGGDEFVIVIPGKGKEQAMITAYKIMSAVKKLNENYTINRQISLSVGVYENEADSVERCMKCVDSAMYDAKRAGKGCVISY